jgi:hypothetical protein
VQTQFNGRSNEDVDESGGEFLAGFVYGGLDACLQVLKTTAKPRRRHRILLLLGKLKLFYETAENPAVILLNFKPRPHDGADFYYVAVL